MSSTETDKAKEKAKEADASQKDEEDKGQTTVDLSKYLAPHDSDSGVRSFAIMSHQQNTAENPDKESTNVLPVYVRRVNSEELLPKPFKSTCQLVCVAYLCLFCCCGFAAWAVKHAWKTQERRNSGVYTNAIKEAKRSLFFMKLALGMGTIFWLVGVGLVIRLLVTGEV